MKRKYRRNKIKQELFKLIQIGIDYIVPRKLEIPKKCDPLEDPDSRANSSSLMGSINPN